MTRILIVAPVGSAMHLAVEAEAARRAVRPDTEVVVRHIEGVPESVYVPPEEVFLPRLIDAVRQGEADGFDAIGISCCSDPGLQECRDAVAVPVTAPFEAAVGRIPELGRLGILYLSVPPAEGESELRGETWIPELLAAYGAADGVGPVLPVPVRRPEVDFGTDGATADLVGASLFAAMSAAMDADGVERARQAVALGAEALFPTCTYWTGTLDRVREQVGVPVLDPLEELARRLEQLAAPAAAPTME